MVYFIMKDPRVEFYESTSNNPNIYIVFSKHLIYVLNNFCGTFLRMDLLQKDHTSILII